MRKINWRKILTIAGYVAAAAVVVFGTIILVAVGRGYSYDPLKGRFTYRGLLVVGSTPNGADIKLNGRDIRKRTPHRTTLEAGDYDLSVSKEGYRTWNKRVTITASEVYFAQYIFLFPEKIKQQTVATHAGISNLIATRDRRHFAYLTGGADPGVWLLEIGGQSASKIHTPKTGEELLELIWSDDSSRLLIKSRFSDRLIFTLVAASSNPSPVNLTDLFKLDFTTLRFNPNNWRELYWLSDDGLLRRIDVAAQTTSAVLADKVSSFTLANDRVYYIGTATTGKSLFSLERGGRKIELAQSLPESPSYQIAYSGFGGRERLAVLPSATRALTLHSGFDTPTPSAVAVAKQVDSISFNTDGRYLAFYSTNGQTLGTYDLEKTKLYSIGAGSKAISQMVWFGNYHLLLNTAGYGSVVEFDGGNLTSLIEVSDGTAVLPTADLRYLVTINKPGSADSAVITAEIK